MLLCPVVGHPQDLILTISIHCITLKVMVATDAKWRRDGCNQ